MIVIAHNIRSLHNVGSIFRSCDAFGISRLYLTGITGTPPRKEIAKVALGSELHVPWEHTNDIKNLIHILKQDGYEVIALENAKGSKDITAYHSKKPFVLILGNEVEGIDHEILNLVDSTLEIPMLNRKQSLNVSVATGIALFALARESR